VTHRIAATFVFLLAWTWTAEASGEASQAGHLEFTTHALSASGAACAQIPSAYEYLMGSLVRGFTRAWASEGHSIQSGEFKVELVFVLDRKAELVHLELESAHPVGAGQDTLLAFRSASPFPPLPEAATCLAGEHYLLEVGHSLRGDPSR